MALVSGQAQYGTRSGSANPGQCHDAFQLVWKYPVVLTQDNLRRTVQVTGSRIVAEPGPLAQSRIGLRTSETADIGKAPDKTLVKRNHGGNLGLLQHNF